MDLRAGQQIDHYTLLEPLGEGGQGSVWKVLDPREGGVMRALKLVSLAETGPAAFERAQREARILAAADHPALVVCHGLFEDPRAGLVGLVMDLVPGETLAEVASREQLDGEHLEAVISHLADALAYIHGRGLVHRDLKPENVLVTDRFKEDPRAPGALKLVDFGIAAPASNPHRLTAAGLVIGTLPYLAPELVDPASWGRTEGPARDVFAFGVMAYLLRFGKHPTGLSSGATMIDYARAYKAAEAGRIARPPPGLEDAVGSAIASCLALRAAERPSDGAAINAILRTGSAPNREAWSGAFEPTTPHREVTARSQASLVERTAPMPAPPVPSARTIATGPALTAVQASPVGKRGCSMTTAVAFGVLAAVVAVVVVGVLGVDLVVADADANASAAPEHAAPTELPTNLDAAGRGRGGAWRVLPAWEAVRSRHVRFGCPFCTREPPRLPRDVAWQMRIGNVTEHLGANRICARVQGSLTPELCLPYSALPDATGARGRLAVSLDDIEGGRIVFTLYVGSRQLVQGLGHRRGDTTPYLASALCMGFSLHVDGPGGDDIPLTVYLDDR